MSGPSSSRALLVGLSASLVAAALVIAFLLGRESARSPGAETALPSAPVLGPEPIVQATEQRRWPEWAALSEWEDVEDPSFAVEPAVDRIEQRPLDGTLPLSQRVSAATAPQAISDSPRDPTGLAVTDYFLRMNTIQSEAGAGDPNTFAMGLIKAGIGGATAGFDQLITDTERMEGEIRNLTPPPSCVSYHEANLRALAETHAILEDMRETFTRRDFSELTTIAQRAGTLQLKVKALREMRERIIADASR